MCPNTSFLRTTYQLGRYNVKGESDCFNCKTGFFLKLFTSAVYERKQLQSTVFAKKSTRQLGIFNNCKEKLSVPRVHTAALTES